MWLSLNYDRLKKWRPIVVTTLIVELVYQAIIYLHPANLEWIKSDEFSLANALQFIFIDQFLIECITVAILFQLIRLYGTRLKLTELVLSPSEIVKYELKFLPLLLIAFFFFAPFTLTTRFFYHQLPDLNWNVYFNDYFYSASLYFNYITPVILIGYSIINVNLIIQYNQQLSEVKQDLTKTKNRVYKSRLWASDEFGEMFLDMDKVRWIERADRKTMAFTDNDQLRLKENISQVEEKLDPNMFVRINRGVIVNLNFVRNYSFWEHDKYVLRMKEGDQEFVMSRDRLNKVKDKFLQTEDV